MQSTHRTTRLDRPPTQPAPSTRPKVRCLDGLRGLAALLVVLQHAGYMGSGAAGVDVFFVLSAFLLTMILAKQVRRLLQQHAHKRVWLFTMLDYFARRFLRVYPLFALVVLVLWLIPDARKTQYFLIQDPESFDAFKVLTFQSEYRYHVFWTLPVEIAYYFVIPVFVLIYLRLGHRWWWPVPLLLTWVCYEGIFKFRTSHQPFRPHLPTFVAGSLGAILYLQADAAIQASSFKFSHRQRVLFRALQYATVVLLLNICFEGALLDWLVRTPKSPGANFVSVPVTLIIVCELILPGSWIGVFLETSVLRFTGKVSYSMYLLHSFVIYQHWIPSGDIERFISVFGLTFLLSWASYELAERPVQTLSSRVSAFCKARASAVSANPTRIHLVTRCADDPKDGRELADLECGRLTYGSNERTALIA